MKEIEIAERKLDELIDSSTTSTANLLKALDMKFKKAGVYSEKRVVEDVTRQRELDGQEQLEAARLATLLVELPCPAYVESQQIVGDVEDSGRHTAPPPEPNKDETGDKEGLNSED